VQFPENGQRLARLSLIDEAGEKHVRMANLACVGSHAINGVAALHSDLLKLTVLHDFYELDPGKFHNVTNGVTPGAGWCSATEAGGSDHPHDRGVVGQQHGAGAAPA